jgi:hypothetical protein
VGHLGAKRELGSSMLLPPVQGALHASLPMPNAPFENEHFQATEFMNGPWRHRASEGARD